METATALNVRTQDEKNNLFTTPCYMLDANILDIARGASNIVKAMLERM